MSSLSSLLLTDIINIIRNSKKVHYYIYYITFALLIDVYVIIVCFSHFMSLIYDTHTLLSSFPSCVKRNYCDRVCVRIYIHECL